MTKAEQLRLKHNKSQREWAANNPDKIRRFQKAWLRRNPQYRVDWHLNRFGHHKLAVLERDGFQCQMCGMTNEEHLRRFGRRITVDHKDGNGRNSLVKNHTVDNLWTLCLSCHGSKDSRRGKDG